jgi:hypothetical protein
MTRHFVITAITLLALFGARAAQAQDRYRDLASWNFDISADIGDVKDTSQDSADQSRTVVFSGLSYEKRGHIVISQKLEPINEQSDLGKCLTRQKASLKGALADADSALTELKATRIYVSLYNNWDLHPETVYVAPTADEPAAGFRVNMGFSPEGVCRDLNEQDIADTFKAKLAEKHEGEGKTLEDRVKSLSTFVTQTQQGIVGSVALADAPQDKALIPAPAGPSSPSGPAAAPAANTPAATSPAGDASAISNLLK